MHPLKRNLDQRHPPLSLHEGAISKSLRKGVKECSQSSAELAAFFFFLIYIYTHIGHDSPHNILEPKPL